MQVVSLCSSIQDLKLFYLFSVANLFEKIRTTLADESLRILTVFTYFGYREKITGRLIWICTDSAISQGKGLKHS